MALSAMSLAAIAVRPSSSQVCEILFLISVSVLVSSDSLCVKKLLPMPYRD